jgi:hypothetical protein
MGAEALLQHLISVGNKSGSIIPAPQGLKKLKEQIEGVPFELLQKGMSGVMTAQNMLQGILGLAKQLGGLQNVGNFQSMNKQVSTAQKNPDELVRIAAALGVEQLTEAVGDNTALTASLSNYG